MHNFDTAIIGAGPAGSTFARLLKASGMSVILIDGQSETARKPCGGLLAPDAQNSLSGMKLTLPKEVLVDPQIFSVKVYDARTRLTRFYPRRYLNMDRLRFDRWLMSMVPDRVEIKNTRVNRIERQKGGFLLSLTGGEELYCRIIVGADGGNSVVRKFILAEAGRKDKIKRYTAIQQWFPDDGKSEPFYSCIFDRDTSPSCSWSAYKDGLIMFGGCFSGKNCREAFDRQKSKLIADGILPIDGEKALKTEACLVCSPKKSSDFILGGNGVFLIGEAAGFISPSSYEGISYALNSGRMLAKAFSCAGDKSDIEDIRNTYAKLTSGLRRKLLLKDIKRRIIFSQPTRDLILRTGVASLKIEP